jgi:O-antigen/teichoic acid export membrane protein
MSTPSGTLVGHPYLCADPCRSASGEDIVTQPTTVPARPRGGGSAVVVALAAANGLGYLLTVVASRRLGPAGYGALAALLGVILVGNVLALALQAVIARRTVVAAGLPGAGRTPSSAAWAGRLTRAAALVAVVLGLLAAVPLTRLLHLDSPAPALLLAVTLGPLTLVGGQLGVLQGGERFHALAQLYFVAAAGKVGGGVLGVALTDSVTGTMVGTAAGAAAAAVVGAVLVSRAQKSPGRATRSLPPGAARETMRATYSLGALFALANLDVVLARHFLEPRQAGLYAVGAVLAKGAFWLPSFVPVIAMPGLADPTRRRRTAARSLAAVAVAGVLVTAVTAVFGELAVRLVGGEAYVSLADRAWLFAATGALLAVVQLLLYSRLAGEDRRVALPMWLLVAAEIGVIWLWRHGSVTEIVTTALATAACVAMLGVLAEVHEHDLLRTRRPDSLTG